MLRGGSLTFRTSSGAILRFGVRDLDVRSAGFMQPVTVSLDGSYNGTPVQLTVRTQSFHDLRSKPGPLDVAFTASTATIQLDFTGTMTDPLAFEGVFGALRINAADLVDALNILGADIPANQAGDAAAIPLALSGAFGRTGDRWELADATGRLQNDDFAGTLSLMEAGRGEPDEADIKMRFQRLDVDSLLTQWSRRSGGGGKSRSRTDAAAMELQFDEKRGMHFNVQVGAAVLAYRKLELSEFSVGGRLAADSGANRPLIPR